MNKASVDGVIVTVLACETDPSAWHLYGLCSRLKNIFFKTFKVLHELARDKTVGS